MTVMLGLLTNKFYDCFQSVLNYSFTLIARYMENQQLD